jgi:phage FluMu gp28-like protein
MPAILPALALDSSAVLAKIFMPHQLHWIQDEEAIHRQRKQAFALAEKSVRIGWTYADAFKNVRKRLHFKNRDYLFATKDYPSALEYIRLCQDFAELFNFAKAVVAHGEDSMKVQRLNDQGANTAFTDEIKIGYIKFDNGSRIRAFSAHPQAMAVYGGDVGLDEFAKHPNARLLWETAQGRVTWGYDMHVWSSHDGQDTLFNTFALQARASFASSQTLSQTSSETFSHPSSLPSPSTTQMHGNPPDHGLLTTASPAIPNQNSKIENPSSPWNLYYRVTIADALEFGLVDVINRVQGTNLTPGQFLSDCRARAGSEEIFQQAYMCNPMGAATNHIVDWSAIENCRADYQILRLHFEHDQVIQQFGPFRPDRQDERERDISEFIHNKFLPLFQSQATYRLGFDVAASGQGDLAVIYLDEAKGSELWLRALFSCRTDDWHFLSVVLARFLHELRYVQGVGDADGLGRQICWQMAKYFPGRFSPANFSAKKSDLGFALMNQLATAQKRFPRGEQDIASDYFALRKVYQGSRWVFTESPNSLNPASHCDIAWAGALATEAHNANNTQVWALAC